jgi:hypothetical protein
VKEEQTMTQDEWVAQAKRRIRSALRSIAAFKKESSREPHWHTWRREAEDNVELVKFLKEGIRMIEGEQND